MACCGTLCSMRCGTQHRLQSSCAPRASSRLLLICIITCQLLDRGTLLQRDARAASTNAVSKKNGSRETDVRGTLQFRRGLLWSQINCVEGEGALGCASQESKSEIPANWRTFHGTRIPRGDTAIPRGACRDSRQPARNLREQRRNEPAHPLASRPSCVARPAAGSKRQWPDNCGHLCASAQCPLQVGQAYSSASEVSAATRSRPLHHGAGCCRAQEKRRTVPAHVVGCSLGRSESPRCKVLSRQLDANVARRRDYVRLHVLARGASSRSNFDAGPPGRLPRPRQNSRYLAMGEALETSRAYHAPALSGTCHPGSRAARKIATRQFPHREIADVE